MIICTETLLKAIKGKFGTPGIRKMITQLEQLAKHHEAGVHAGYTFDFSRIKRIAEGTQIAIIWSTEDVIEFASQDGIKITEEEAMEILGDIDHRHDCNYGVTWDTLSYCINDYKGEECP